MILAINLPLSKLPPLSNDSGIRVIINTASSNKLNKPKYLPRIMSTLDTGAESSKERVLFLRSSQIKRMVNNGVINNKMMPALLYKGVITMSVKPKAPSIVANLGCNKLKVSTWVKNI